MNEFQSARNRDLIKRFLAGDRDAFSSVYRDHHPGVFRFALHMTGDSAKATEVTQDVFVWLIHHAGDFDPARGELAAFLMGVTRKFLHRRYAEERRWVPFEDSHARPVMPAPDPGPDAAERLRAAILRLPEAYREVVVLCDLEEQSYEEAAHISGCAVGTVRSRLHRARALLARKLKGNDHASRRLSKCAD